MLSRLVARLPPARCSTPIPLRSLHRPVPSPQTSTPPLATATLHLPSRPSSSSSSTRWKARASTDPHTRAATLAGLKSRAAFKLLEINAKHTLFRRGDTVVDLGFAPGSWSQVAVNRTAPGGRVIGIDVIPAQPPRGVSTLQGDFLSGGIREEVGRFVREGGGGRGGREEDVSEGRVVDVVLSDMSAPWPLGQSEWVRSVSNPWRRMMNTSGMAFRDHAGSMDLCNAAFTFCYDTLVTGGNFLCKFYQGAEDSALEARLKRLFEKVHRIKPESSRKESREAYFVCLRRRADVARGEVLDDGG